MVILGVDPGLATMGWGVIETDGNKHRMVQYGTLGTPAGEALPVRLRAIYSGVQQLISTFGPDDIAFEELFFARNVTTALAVGAARGVALVAASQHTENLYEYTPMQIKQAVVGYGKADKHQVQTMVKMLLSLPEIPRPDDAADALAAAITHAHSARQRALFKIK
ncbi:MAG TPA: crossover junction endodeoxyribonuclease RuvC [Candidatus Aphodomonas merdavium]|nr:crossover junction endodeoxyribonuclease RuvC [Candidatus Aphodomonas merdavium]